MQWKNVGSKTLRCCKVDEDALVVAYDVDVEGFIPNGLHALHNVAINQYVIDHLVSLLVGGKSSEAMSFEASIQGAAFAVQF